jgi:SAM-dependent methyltransferase
MNLGRQLARAWSYTQPGGGKFRRIMVMGAWGAMKVEERLTDFYYERRGLHTLGRDWDLHGAGTALNGYVPTPWHPLREIFRSWPMTSDDVLLDYGCGKGRTTTWAAANFRFRRVIGIELDQQLHKVAQENLARWNGLLLCSDVELICEDATHFDVPDDVTVIFFGNPFTGDVFEKVADKIQASLIRNPRQLVILYYHPLMHDSLVKAGFTVEREQLNRPYEWKIYRGR